MNAETIFYNQRILKSEQTNGRNPPTHPNPNVVQILKSVEKNGWSLTQIEKKRTISWTTPK